MIGFFNDQLGQHGFIRATDGTFTTIDAPGATNTVAVAENHDGTIVGSYFVRTDHGGSWRAFIRSPDGQFTEFQAPHSGRYTYLTSINNTGWITGTGRVGRLSGDYFFGFIRSPSGRFTEFGQGLMVNCANSTLTTAGELGTHGFVRTPDGTIVQFDPEGGTYTGVSGINNSGTAIGSSKLAAPNSYEGYIRAADGTTSTFVASPDAAVTAPMGINKTGVIVGSYQNTWGSSIHGFVRALDGTITTIDVPRGSDTQPYSINDRGHVTGQANVNGVIQGFIWRP